MALYSCTARLPAIWLDQNIPLVEVQSSPTDYLRIIDVFGSTFFSETGFVYTLGLGVPAARGILRTTSPIFAPSDVNSSKCQSVFGQEWVTPPTTPTKFFRRLSRSSGPNSVQPSQLFSFYLSNGFTMPPSSSFVLWLITGPAPSVSVPASVFEATFDIDA
jgi:hypothetical protein